MRTLLVLTCCFGLALFAGAAQPDDQGNQQGKKKGQGNAPAQTVAPSGPRTSAHAMEKGALRSTVKSSKSNTSDRSVNLNSSKSNKLEAIHKGGAGKSQEPVTGQTQANVSGGNAPSSAGNTKFGKGKFSSQTNVTGGAKFQKQHFNLQTNKVVTKYKTVNFNQNYKIAGAQNWTGAKYQVFVNYQPVWQPTWWWNWHYGSHIVFIYGGWYYWNANYWYPAWGYAPDSVYYYDGPIYASSPEEDPAQVVANVQSALQQQGYYQGDIDGVLGPQTRAALAEYQSAQGIEPTGAVDEPTLETLGMA